MKQFQTIFKKERGFSAWLSQIRKYLTNNDIKESSVLFRIFSDSLHSERLSPVLGILRKTFPDASYAGISTIGNVIHGSLTDTGITLSCTVFENPETKIRVLQLPMTFDKQEESARKLLKTIEESPWVNSVEMLTTLSEVDMPLFCREMSGMPKEIMFYGGGAHATDIGDGNYCDTFVLSSDGGLGKLSAVFVLTGGPDLNIFCSSLTGWRRLGGLLEVTSSKKNLLLELNGQPAADVYQHYLHIPNDERFYRLANEFPLLFEDRGTPVLRDVIAAYDDGSLRLGSTIEGVKACCITYGDPLHIMKAMREEVKKVHAFAPQSIQLFSCAARRFFWGDSQVSRETLPFESLAPTSGFFTSGEFLRAGENIHMHNLTLVIVAMREGEVKEPPGELNIYEKDVFPHQLMVSSCLASFIQAQREEFEK